MADCEIAGQWETLFWYAARAEAEHPDDRDIELARARAYLQRGEPARCLAAATRAAELGAEPDFLFRIARDWALRGRWLDAASVGRLAIRPGICVATWSPLAVIFLEARHRDDYRRFCARILADEDLTTSWITVADAAWTCSLAPAAVDDFRGPIDLARRFLTEPRSPGGRHAMLNALGALLYRAGRYQDALDTLNRAIAADGKQGQPRDLIFLAMTHHRLGQAGEARRGLDQVPGAQLQGKDGIDWDALEIDVLRREADAMIRYDPIFPSQPLAPP